MYIDSQKLLDLYTTTYLLKISIDTSSNQQKKSKVEASLLTYQLLTPTSKIIYDSFNKTADKKKFLIDINLDDNLIDDIEKYYEEKDLYYEDENPSSIGFYIEHYLSAELKCPVCDELSLCIYKIPNMPVIDLCCINTEHKIEDGVKFFQVKARNKDSIFHHSSYNLYFSKKKKYIYTGSKNFGYNSHIIKGNELLNKKKILIGYICVTYAQDNTNINIISNESFILLPKITITDDEYYYKYIESSFKQIITWTENMFDLIDFPIKKIKICQLKEEERINDIFLTRLVLTAGYLNYKLNKYIKKLDL